MPSCFQVHSSHLHQQLDSHVTHTCTCSCQATSHQEVISDVCQIVISCHSVSASCRRAPRCSAGVSPVSRSFSSFFIEKMSVVFQEHFQGLSLFSFFPLPCALVSQLWSRGSFSPSLSAIWLVLEVTSFSRCKSVHKMATGKSDDELIQLDNKMRIWDTKWKIQKKSGKSRIAYGLVTKHDADANDNIHACVTVHDADVNDNIYNCVALHNAYTTEHFH